MLTISISWARPSSSSSSAVRSTARRSSRYPASAAPGRAPCPPSPSCPPQRADGAPWRLGLPRRPVTWRSVAIHLLSSASLAPARPGPLGDRRQRSLQASRSLGRRACAAWRWASRAIQRRAGGSRPHRCAKSEPNARRGSQAHGGRRQACGAVDGHLVARSAEPAAGARHRRTASSTLRGGLETPISAIVVAQRSSAYRSSTGRAFDTSPAAERRQLTRSSGWPRQATQLTTAWLETAPAFAPSAAWALPCKTCASFIIVALRPVPTPGLPSAAPEPPPNGPPISRNSAILADRPWTCSMSRTGQRPPRPGASSAQPSPARRKAHRVDAEVWCWVRRAGLQRESGLIKKC